MKSVCTQCNKDFLSSNGRKLCWVCKPHPRVPNPTLVFQENQRGLSCQALAVRYGVNSGTLWYILRSIGVPRLCECITLSFPEVKLDVEWIDGWLLGDGHIGMSDVHSRTAEARHSSKYKEYCEYVVSHWVNMGLKPSRIYTEFRPTNGSSVYRVRCGSHPELTSQYLRWYPKGHKCIPLDLKMTSVVLREWYLGDGSLHRGRSPQLYMGGLTVGEVDRMKSILDGIFGGGVSRIETIPSSNQLTKCGTLRQVFWRLHFSVKIAAAFFAYIGSCPLVCYQYKWPE